MDALSEAGRTKAKAVLSTLSGYAPTPLIGLPALADKSGVASIHVKDEGQRFGLKSFKALGGAYAVVSLVLAEAGRQLGRVVETAELSTPEVRAVAETITFACATDGNHGRSVAWGAQVAGARCEIFIHAGVSQGRADAMAAYGARINRIDGTYDDSVALAAETAAKSGWTVVSDTAWPGYEDIPLTVMQGYTVMIGEALDVLPAPPTHLFLQAGVGGMAAAVAAYAHQRLGSNAPKIVVVEPARAACLFETAKAGEMTTIPHNEPTVMAMLECATPSPLGWEVLHHLADGYVTLEEHEAVDAMRLLAGISSRMADTPTPNPSPQGGGGLGADVPVSPSPLWGGVRGGGIDGDTGKTTDPIVVAGESGCTGLAGFLACLADPEAKAHLGLGPNSRILVFNSEGATDPAIYAQLVGRAPQEVLA
ncbi:MAG: diaminopropionate ammonia-lyase [Rhizobiaceae bacterium]